MTESSPILEPYRRLATDAAAHSHVPFSGKPASVVLVLDDQRWIPGVRVESASFSLTIPPLLNAVTTAVALEAGPITAVVASRDFEPHELAFAERATMLKHLSPSAPFAIGKPDAGQPGERVSPFLSTPSSIAKPERGLKIARRIAHLAYVPESDFRVGALLELESGGCIPGVNVEHADWMHILCAERNALGTAISYGLKDVSDIYLACVDSPGCTPCGACRQLMAELAPTSALWMDGDEDSPASSHPIALLPGFFAGNRISRNS